MLGGVERSATGTEHAPWYPQLARTGHSIDERECDPLGSRAGLNLLL